MKIYKIVTVSLKDFWLKISIQALELISYNLSYFDCFTIIQTFDLTFCFTVSHERLWHEKEVYHENWSTYVSTITSNFVLIIGTFGIPFTLTFWGYIFESVTAKNELNCGIQAIIFVTYFRNEQIDISRLSLTVDISCAFDSKLYHLMSVSINWLACLSASSIFLMDVGDKM